MKQGKLSASRQNARRARRRFGEAGDHEQEIQLRLVVVRACLAKDERGNRQQRDAFREAQEAMKMAAELGKSDLMAMTLAAYARASYEMGQYESCCETVEELLQMQARRSDCRLSALCPCLNASVHLSVMKSSAAAVSVSGTTVLWPVRSSGST